MFSYDWQSVSANIACFVKGSLIIFSYDQQGVSDIPHLVKGTVYHYIFSYDSQLVCDVAHFVKGSLITAFCTTNSLWVALDILWRAVSPHLFLWPTVCKWHCTFCGGQSHHIFSYDQQSVSGIAHLQKALSSHPFLWPTGCEWHSTSCERQSHQFFSYDQ